MIFDTDLSGDELRAASVLATRAAAPRGPARESRALDRLIGRINAAPDRALQALVETAVDLCGAGSAGVSVLQGDHFVWPAIAGAWAHYAGQGMPRSASPCGIVIDHNEPLLFEHPQRLFRDAAGDPPITEILLVPLLSDRDPRGTLWALSHDDRRFTAEDARVLERMALVAAAIEGARRARDRERRTAESAHDRMRNTLAAMRALVRRGDETARDFEGAAFAKLSSRLGAFAEGAGGQGRDGTVELWALIQHLLALHGERTDKRIALTGPTIVVPASAAGPLALALHELIENAFEHGALARPAGRIDVAWRLDDRAGARELDLVWREHGSGSVAAEPMRGFGFELLEGLPTLIGATTDIAFANDGLRSSLRLPLDDEPPPR